MNSEKLTMNLGEVAALLDKSPRSVKEDIRRRPEAVPPHVMIPGSRRLLWRRKDVKRWLNALPTTDGTATDSEWNKYRDAA